MPDQTSITTEYEVPDGSQVLIDYPIGTGYVDIGEIEGDTDITYEHSEFQGEQTNAGVPEPIAKNQTLKGTFKLRNINYSNLELLGNGLFTKEVTTSTPVTTNLTNQVIAAGWAVMDRIPIEVINSVSGISYRGSALSLTSVTGSTSGVCAAGDDYFLIEDPESSSGFSIQLTDTGAATLATSETVTIVFASITPIDSIKLSAGTTKKVKAPFGMKIQHTDSAGKMKITEIWRCYSQSGSFNFGFMGPAVDGWMSQPISWMAVIDTSKTDGKQLFTSTKESGAI